MIPSCSIPIQQRGFVDTDFHGPISQTHRPSLEGKNDVVFSVALLIRCCGPAAVFRRVVAGCVNAINCVPIGPFAHVRKEILKRLPPAVTHGYAQGSIAFVSCGTRSVASGNHVDPGPIGGRHANTAFRMTVLGHIRSCSTRPAAVLSAPGRDRRPRPEKFRPTTGAMAANLSVFHGGILQEIVQAEMFRLPEVTLFGGWA